MNLRTMILSLTCWAIGANYSTARAAGEVPYSFSLEGVLFDSPHGTTPLEDSHVEVEVQITDPSGACVLYAETQAVSTLGSGGVFNIQVGSAIGAGKRVGGRDPGNSMAAVFQNRSAVAATGASCGGGVYTPAAGAIRLAKIVITPSSSGIADVLSPAMEIGSVPTALVANSLDGIARTGFLQVDPSANVTQSNLESIFTAGGFSALSNLISGGSAASSGSYTINAGTAGTGGIDFSINGSLKATIANNGNFSVDGGSLFVSAGTDRVGIGTTSPNASLDLSAKTDALILPRGTSAQRPSPVMAGMVRYNSDLSKIEYHDGLAWSPLGSDISGISAGGDLSGSYPNPTVAKIQNTAVSGTAPTLGQVLKFTSGSPSVWAAVWLNLNDLKGADDVTSVVASAACASDQALYFNVTSKLLECQSIGSLAAAAISSGQVAVARGGTGVATAPQNLVFAGPTSGSSGPPAFRALAAADLPSALGYWATATGGINFTGGNVGIGSSAPDAALDVGGRAVTVRGSLTNAGELRLGAAPSVGSNYVGFKGPATNPSASRLWSLPAADGASGDVLATDGAGNLGWVGAGSGSIASIGLNGPGGIFSVSNSPLTSDGSIDLTTAGTSGGIPYFSGSSVLSSSAVLASNGIVLGGGAGTAPTALSPVAAGRILSSAGASSPPAYTATPTLGSSGAGGSLSLAGATGGTVTIQPQPTAGTYNFNLPTAAGTAGQALLSGGGASSPMTWGNLGVAAGGTGLSAGSQGGVPYFASASTMASTAAGTTGNVLSSNGTSAPAWAALNLAGGSGYVSGTLPIANGGTGAANLTAAGIFQNGGNSFAAAASIGTNDGNSLTLRTNNAGAVTILASGNVGIGSTSPANKLDVAGSVSVSGGQVVSAIQTTSATSPLTFDTNLGNTIIWSNTASALTVNIHNMKAGGTYSLVVAGNSSSTGTVTINCFSGAGSGALASSFVPGNGGRVAGTLNKTIYTLFSDGTNCLVTWITGF